MTRNQRSRTILSALVLLLVYLPKASSFQLGQLWGAFQSRIPKSSATTASPIATTKQELLKVISKTGNGKDATFETQKSALQLVRFLEINAPVPNDLLKDPVASKALNGVWYLQYTAPSDVNLDDMEVWNQIDGSEGQSKIDTRKVNIQGSVRAAGITVDTSNRLTTQIIDLTNQRIQNNVEQDFGTITVEGSFRVSETVGTRAIVAFDKANIVFRSGFTLSLGFVFAMLALLRGTNDSGWLETTFVDDDIRIGRGNKGSLFILTRDKDAVEA